MKILMITAGEEYGRHPPVMKINVIAVNESLFFIFKNKGPFDTALVHPDQDFFDFRAEVLQFRGKSIDLPVCAEFIKAPANHIKIDVADTGHGISEDNMSKLFTPFFTTKERGQGVGLGLAVIHGIIQRHHGKIDVASEEGKGTIFTIYLGVQDEEQS